MRSTPASCLPQSLSAQAKFIDVDADGNEGEVLQQYKTKRKSDTRCPVFNETFTMRMFVLEQTKLELTVWDHDLGGIGNDFWGRHTIARLSDVTLPINKTQERLQVLAYSRHGRKQTALLPPSAAH